MAKEYKLSAERLKELQEELNYLKTVREKEVAELIKEARSYGDLSENSEYDEAKDEQGRVYSRIAEVENILLPRAEFADIGLVAIPRVLQRVVGVGYRCLELQGANFAAQFPCDGYQLFSLHGFTISHSSTNCKTQNAE